MRGMSHQTVVATAGDWILLGCLVLFLFFVWTRARTRLRWWKHVSAVEQSEDAGRVNHFPLNWSGSEFADSSGWHESLGKPTSLYLHRPGLAANVRCDPVCRERICLSTLCFWRERKPSVRRDGNGRPLAPTPSELFETIEGMLAMIVASGLAPTVVVFEPGDEFEFWRQWLEDNASRLAPHRRENKSAFEWRQRSAPIPGSN